MSDFLKQFESNTYEHDSSNVLPDFEPLDTFGDAARQQVGEGHEMAAGEEHFAHATHDHYHDGEVYNAHAIEDDAPYDHTGNTIDMHPVPPQTSPDSKRAIARTDHTVKKDSTYDKRKIIRYATIALSVITVCLLAFAIFFISNQVVVRDFVGSNISEARTWGISNRITIEPTEEYSLEYDADIIMEQNRTPDSRISRGSVLRLTVSRGPNMTEHLELPDFSTMTTAEVREWRQEVRADSANINEEYNDEVEAGRFIRYEFTSSSVTRENYTRGDGLLIYMSRGVQVFEANIVVPNFFDEPLSAAQEWAREQNVELVVREGTHNSVEAGNIIEQSAAADSRVARGDEVTVTVSQGMAITVPNFSNISFEDAAEQPGLEVTVQRRYSANLPFGRLMSQSIAAGTELVGDGHQITVVYSLGRPFIDDLRNNCESGLPEYFYGFTSRGANITYSIFYVDSYRDRGTIVRMSHFSQFLPMNAHVRIDISRGNLRPPPGADLGDGDMGNDDY